MLPDPYRRSVDDLRINAVNFWPPEISQLEEELSIVPRLLATQEVFISILKISVSDIESMFAIVDASTMSANLFLKHLMVLADYGGEQFKRISKEHKRLFPTSSLSYKWVLGAKTIEQTYNFKAYPNKKFSNSSLGLTGKKLLKSEKLTDLQKDAIAILLFGASSIDEDTAGILVKCEISEYLGQPEKLEQFVRQRYIWVSRIINGSKANTLGQLVQQIVRRYLENHIKINDVKIFSNGHIPDIRHVNKQDKRLTTFDLVVQHNDKYVAVEISFQETTNSTIERKSGQAQARYEQLNAKGYKIAYLLDGAGNFERDTALSTLCMFSDCTVAFSPTEMEVLRNFITEYFLNG